MRIAFIVSNPVQYYVPLYREFAKRVGVMLKVFYTWRDAGPVLDEKFDKSTSENP